MPLETQDSFRNRKWEAFCLKYFRLCAREKERVCVSIRGALVRTHPARLVGSRAGIRLAWPYLTPLLHKGWLVLHSHFP